MVADEGFGPPDPLGDGTNQRRQTTQWPRASSDANYFVPGGDREPHLEDLIDGTHATHRISYERSLDWASQDIQRQSIRQSDTDGLQV